MHFHTAMQERNTCCTGHTTIERPPTVSQQVVEQLSSNWKVHISIPTSAVCKRAHERDTEPRK